MFIYLFVSTLKTSAMADWPVAHGAYTIGSLLRSIPIGCQIGILLDSENMDLAFMSCEEMDRRRFDPVEYASLVQWRNTFQEMRKRDISGEIRKFDEEREGGFIRMRMIATWQAKDTMQCGASESDNPSTFLARRLGGGKPNANKWNQEDEVDTQRKRMETVWFLPIMQSRVLHQSMRSHRGFML
jgi:hypothetical protein